MEVVDILGNQVKRRGMTFQVHQGAMGGVGFSGGDALSSRLIPFPHQPWISLKSLRCRQILGPIVSPQTAQCITEGRHSALGGYSGPGQDNHPVGLTQPFDNPFGNVTIVLVHRFNWTRIFEPF
jgi:hypothetical protein